MQDNDQVEDFFPEEGEPQPSSAPPPEAAAQASPAVEEETPPEAETPLEAEEISLEQWEALAPELGPREVTRGDIVQAVVAEVQDQAIIVDLGTKYEGFIPRNEFASEAELPAVGETLAVAIMAVDEKNESIRVSKKRADYERVWSSLQEAAAQGTTIKAMVTERVKGGLRVDVGVPGFVPASQVVVRDVRTLDRFVGRILPLRVLEIDRRGNRVILSHGQAVEEERRQRQDKTLARLYEGAVCEGRVASLTEYGAFIDLGGIDGLLHISEMSWQHLNHPSEVLQKGSIVRVMVLSIEQDGARISLSRRELLPDPWKEVQNSLRLGQTVVAEITRVVATGVFARPAGLELEGFIPLRELSDHRIRRADEVVSVGQKLEVKIIDLQPSARKLLLSVVQAGAQRQRAEEKGYQAAKDSGVRMTLGDQFGDILRDAKAALEEEAQAVAAAEPEVEPAAEPGAEPAAESEAEVAPKPKPARKKPAVEPEAQPAAEPKAKRARAKPAAAEPEAQPVAEPETEAPAEPEAQEAPPEELA